MDEIINYVMDTPGNTNPNVLRGMLQNNSGGSDNIFLVKIRPGEEDDTFISDKTYEEITEAFNEDKIVIMEAPFLNGGIFSETYYRKAFVSARPGLDTAYQAVWTDFTPADILVSTPASITTTFFTIAIDGIHCDTSTFEFS